MLGPGAVVESHLLSGLGNSLLSELLVHKTQATVFDIGNTNRHKDIIYIYHLIYIKYISFDIYIKYISFDINQTYII